MFSRLSLPEALRRFRSVYYRLAMASDAPPHHVLLDSCGWGGKTGGFYLMGFEAERVIQFRAGALRIDGDFQNLNHSPAALWQTLAGTFQRETLENKANLSGFPFENGWVGAFGYELNHLLEPNVSARASGNPMGELLLVRFRHRVLWDAATGRLAVQSPDSGWQSRVQAMLDDPETETVLDELDQPVEADVIQASLDQTAFEDRVREIQAHIRRGNIYQTNLSMRFETRLKEAADLLRLYNTLVNRNPSPFSGVFWTPEGVIVSNSPERLVKFNRETGILETRPIAGTRGRGQTAAEEDSIAKTLQTDVKEQAEHLMLVDLSRNDLGRVSEAGSVHVPELATLERYSHVTHIVSQVEGRKRPDASAWDILAALFPGGTITGCPKIRCMQVLRDLEPVPRGFYTGSLGYLDFSGNLDLNILIRSVFRWPDTTLHFHAGAGIVADSVPAWEYRECHRKAQAIQGVLTHVADPCHR